MRTEHADGRTPARSSLVGARKSGPQRGEPIRRCRWVRHSVGRRAHPTGGTGGKPYVSVAAGPREACDEIQPLMIQGQKLGTRGSGCFLSLVRSLWTSSAVRSLWTSSASALLPSDAPNVPLRSGGRPGACGRRRCTGGPRRCGKARMCEREEMRPSFSQKTPGNL